MFSKKCKVCGVNFESPNGNRVYCDLHLYGWNKDITDPKIVKEELKKKKEEDVMRQEEYTKRRLQERLMTAMQDEMLERMEDIKLEIRKKDLAIDSLETDKGILTKQIEILKQEKEIYLEEQLNKFKHTEEGEECLKRIQKQMSQEE